MADEENQQAEGETKGKKSKKKLIIILAVVLIAGGAGAFFALKGGGEAAEEGEQAAEGEKTAANANLPGAVYPLEVFIVNLGVKGSFLKAAVNLEFFDPEPPKHIESEVPRIRDSIIRVMSSKTSAEILTNEGKEILRKEVMDAANDALDAEEVADVYFTEFIVQ